MRSGSVAAVTTVVLAVTGCGTRPDGVPAPFTDTRTTPSAGPGAPPPTPLRATGGGAATGRPPGPSTAQSTGWTLTVYYTAVETLHTGAATTVRGCTELDCADGDDDLGSYPADFVRAVRDEGTGRTADDRYLNWSEDVGFWLDDAPRDTDGRPLRPFVSAAADADVLAPGTAFTVADCGVVEDGTAPPRSVCERLRAARWRITDAFTTGLGGARHLDLYIGEESGARLTETDWYVTLTGARITVRAREPLTKGEAP